MPFGKSGKQYFNPAVMKSHGDEPDGDEGAQMPAAKVEDGKGGDGMHHHQLHAHDDGSYHSVHKHPDGREEYKEHPTFGHAVSHMSKAFGESEEEGSEREGMSGQKSALASSSSSLGSMYE